MQTDCAWIKMDDIAHTQSSDAVLKNAARIEEDAGEPRVGDSSAGAHEREEEEEEGEARTSTGRRRPWARKRKSYSHAHFKVYKRRWFGLAQLVLLNAVVSWDVSIFIQVVMRT
jgi:FLVCR family MFS transporter 7